jgi:hypothetical protein
MEGWEIVDWIDLAYKMDQWLDLAEHGTETSQYEYIRRAKFHDLLSNRASEAGLGHRDQKTVISLVSLLVSLLLAGWLVGWLVGWLFGCLVGWLFSWLFS